MKRDILQHIADALDVEDIIDRLGLSSEEVCKHFHREIMNNLEAFDDVYSEDEADEEDEYEGYDE
jgi:AraC-like DNA-binding protein